MPDQFIRRCQNFGRAAKIFFQTNQFHSGKILFKPKDIFDLGTAPAVHRLIRIAGDTQVWFHLRQCRDNLILGSIRILVFVDQNEAVAFVERLPQFVVFGQHPRDMKQQVIKVDSIGFEQSLLVGGIDSRDDRVDVRSDGLGMFGEKLIGGDQVVFRFADPSEQLPGWKMRRIEIEILQDIFQEGQLIADIIN